MSKVYHLHSQGARRDGSVVSVSAFHGVVREFAPRLGHTEDHHKNGTNCLLAWPTSVRLGVRQSNLTVKGRVVCGIVYGGMQYKNTLRSIIRVGYHNAVFDFYIVPHGL